MRLGGKALVPVSSLLPFLGLKVKTEATDLSAFTAQIHVIGGTSIPDQLRESSSIYLNPKYPPAALRAFLPAPPIPRRVKGPAASARSAPPPQPAVLRLRWRLARTGCRSP